MRPPNELVDDLRDCIGRLDGCGDLRFASEIKQIRREVDLIVDELEARAERAETALRRTLAALEAWENDELVGGGEIGRFSCDADFIEFALVVIRAALADDTGKQGERPDQ